MYKTLNNGINYQPQLVSRISAINSSWNVPLACEFSGFRTRLSNNPWFSLCWGSTLPETNIFAPENGWLEYDRSFPFGALGLFSGVNSLLVSGIGLHDQEPYHVLVDGTFLTHALQQRIFVKVDRERDRRTECDGPVMAGQKLGRFFVNILFVDI